MILPEISLLDALKQRRSRRFCLGMSIPSGPLKFQSSHRPVPLSARQEALIVFAAAGITGPALVDLPFNNGAGGNIMAGLLGRTVSSGDAIQTVSLIVVNDSGAWFYKRPQDFPAANVRELLGLASQNEFTKIAELSRVQIADKRVHPPAEPLFNLNVNRWAAQAPGTSYFLPVNELSLMYINGLLEIFNEQTGAYVLDERAGFRPAGLAAFAKSRGGHLHDNPADGRVATIALIERLVTEFVTLEQGMMLQNAALMTHALALGGHPNFANHDFGWFSALEFEMHWMPVSRYFGMRGLARLGLKLFGKDAETPVPIGLKRDGQMLLESFIPPCYPSMKAAVEAVVERKFGRTGIFRASGALQAWSDPATRSMIEPISDKAIQATIAYCEYLWKTYGRFPVHMAPLRTVAGFQAGHLDADFYDKFYPEGTLNAAQREDFSRAVDKDRARASA